MYRDSWWLQDENDGEGNDLGGAPEPSAPEPAGDAGGEATQAAEGPAGDEPKSMLEAIEQGLAGDKKPQTEQAPAKPEQAQAKPSEKTSDIPEGLSPRAHQRFVELTKKISEGEARYAELEKNYQQAHEYASQFSSMIKSIGASPDQLQGAADYIRAYNSGDLQTRKNILLNELRDVSMRLGEPVDNFIPQADPLNMFPDLKQAVDSYQISREQALELVRHRFSEQQRNQQQEHDMQQQQARQTQVNQWVTEKDSALAEIDKITREMASSDPMFPAVQAQLMDNQGGLADIVQNFPPSTWVSQVKLLISSIKTAMQASGQRGGGEPRPLSGAPGKPQGSAKAPSSMYEAMFGGR